MLKKIFLIICLVILSASTVFAAVPLTPQQMQDILATPKGERPAPETYLSQKYIQNHLKKFKNGLSIITSLKSFEKYMLHADEIGREDNTCFVMPKSFCDKIEKEVGGDISVWEKILSFDPGYFASQGGIVRIDILEFKDLNLRIPDGNEAGANEYWIPGGYTVGDTPEAVTNRIPKTRIIVRFLPANKNEKSL